MANPYGMITVTEAARRLGRSLEQVRRYLREGKLKGERIGQQWFIEEASLGLLYRPAGGRLRRVKETAAVLEVPMTETVEMTKEEIEVLFRRIDEHREAIRKRIGGDLDIDIVELLHEDRESH